MSRLALTNGRVMAGGGLQGGLAVEIAGGRIVGLGPEEALAPETPRYDLEGALLLARPRQGAARRRRDPRRQVGRNDLGRQRRHRH